MTTLLALDTSTEACSVALLHNGQITSLDEVASRTHTQRILPMIDEILAQSGLRLNQVDALVFGRGPGSFTGVRVGTGIVQGLALGADLPVIGISDLEAMAQQAFEQNQATQVMTAIDARMNEVYFSQLTHKAIQLANHEGVFSQWDVLLAEEVASPERVIQQLNDNTTLAKANEWQRVGTGWDAYAEFAQVGLGMNSEIILPSARFMLSLALPKFLQQQWQDAVSIEPIYLRNQVTWKKLPGRD
ncbi:tRNA threonylcarbamoyladenosine biosynthesis protein TsaB [Actinobacillus delphinicola]|uniref:tRNA threonylcarbamoyladenosine biosynthesis protein TsaB n=2 Tax=Actinobacillus delphinicola TaxID=51161 RepID=A0A448TVQ0_9PAST|nr:tRNA threonylcarbamoyladenosine biosynthesis protein TsaB [Actinobacillus delphinicola]VEJ10004.1 peptidase M22 glycoprotease [Actinobacillus delphinicola]